MAQPNGLEGSRSRVTGRAGARPSHYGKKILDVLDVLEIVQHQPIQSIQKIQSIQYHDSCVRFRLDELKAAGVACRAATIILLE